MKYHIKSKEVFVQQAQAIWGDRYDYTDSVYQGGKKPIEIYCPKHDFRFRVAMAQNHILPAHGAFKPTACPVCQAEKKHRIEYDKDWSSHLILCKKQSRVAKIDAIREKEHREKERLKRKSKNIEKEKARRDYIVKYNAKSLIEARFIERVHEMYGQIYDTNNVDYEGCDIPVTLICEKHGPFAISPRTLLRGDHGRKPHGCPQCEGVKCYKPTIDPESLFERLETLYGGDLVFEKGVVKSRHKSVIARCKKHGRVKHTVNYWLTGKGCEYCNGLWFQPDWEKYARQIHGDKYEYLSAPKTKTNVIKIKCPDHGIFLQRYDVHVDQQCGCPECTGSKVLSKEKRKENFLKKAREKFGDRFSYTIEEYVNNDTPMSITCKAHNFTFRSTPDTHLRKSGGCPVCGMTSGEARIFTWLRQQGINHHYQYYIPNENKNLDLQYLVADFYLPAQNMIIEFNGQQHYTDVPYFHRDKDWNIEKQMMRDQTLRDYCTKHGIQLLEIKYKEETMIPEILAKKISP